MNETIGKFLPITLVVIAFLLLMAPRNGTEAPAQTTEPVSDVSTGITAQTEATQPSNGGPERVENVLSSSRLDETATAHCVYDKTLYDTIDGRGRDAMAHTLARLCGERRMNPIAAFWLLEEEGLYETSRDLTGKLSVPGFRIRGQEPKQYAYTAGGARELLTDLLTLSGSAADSFALESGFLGRNDMVDEGQIHLEEGECYYAYFVLYGERSAHFLCFYLRGGELIEDVEFQLLNLRYAEGDQKELSEIDQQCERQASALMAAAELLMTGHSRADQGSIPFDYELEGFDVSIERFDFTASGESGSLMNYRLRISE